MVLWLRPGRGFRQRRTGPYDFGHPLPMSPFRSVDPSTGAPRAHFALHGPAEIEDRVRSVTEAARANGARPVSERATLLRALAAALRADLETDALLMADEMGKPLTQGRGEVEKCAWTCSFAADHAVQWLQAEVVLTEARRSEVHRRPMGVVLAVMPWNFPFWQVLRFAAGAIAAGNAVLLKHAPNVPELADRLDGLCARAGVPPDLIRSIRVDVPTIGPLLADPRIAALTFTGSTTAGRALAAAAGAALKPSVLELGGSDPFIVLADADLDLAADLAARARLQNNGQSCIAAKRFVVERAVAAPFIERLRDRLSEALPSDPRQATCKLGPMARADLRDTLHDQVRRSVAAGATLALGGAPTPGSGWFYPATLLTDCRPGHAVWDEETFGPVAAVRVVDDRQAALAAAVHGPYGLGATILSADVEAAAAMAAHLPAGAVFVNDLLRSDPRLPFGGTRDSGWGRELGRDGMLAFTHCQSLWIR